MKKNEFLELWAPKAPSMPKLLSVEEKPKSRAVGMDSKGDISMWLASNDALSSEDRYFLDQILTGVPVEETQFASFVHDQLAKR